jgi:hypothetical protein
VLVVVDHVVLADRIGEGLRDARIRCDDAALETDQLRPVVKPTVSPRHHRAGGIWEASLRALNLARRLLNYLRAAAPGRSSQAPWAALCWPALGSTCQEMIVMQITSISSGVCAIARTSRIRAGQESFC